MPCGCGEKSKSTKVQPVPTKSTSNNLVVGKSKSNAKVHLRYYGGGLTRQTTGCSSCGSQGKYALTTSETIQFPSDDAPMGWFSQFFTVSEDYWVTEKQAERLLKETFTNAAGQVVHKFKVIE